MLDAPQESLDNIRPSWDDIFMELAFCFRKRSPDNSTKHGAAIVSPDRSQISMGYNGYPKNCSHEKMPKGRPDKYLVTIHAEHNAILNASFPLRGSTLYVTGVPCNFCWMVIIQKEISRVVMGPIQSKCVDQACLDATTLLLENQNITTDVYDGPFLAKMIKELNY